MNWMHKRQKISRKIRNKKTTTTKKIKIHIDRSLSVKDEDATSEFN